MSSPVAHTGHHAPQGFIKKYIFSLDHKVIGIQYYFLGLFSVLIGMSLSVLMRFHMVHPDAKVSFFASLWPKAAAGGVMTPELYLSLMTMHGTIMVFFVLTTAPFAAFGNFFLPIQVGAEDMPFPRFNMMSFWVTFVAFLVAVSAFFVGDGPSLAGWTQYAPLSAVGSVAGPGEGTGEVLWASSIAIFCVGQLLGSLNFITTTLDLRTKGMTLMRMPLSTWAWFITSCIGLLAFAVLLPACLLLVLDRIAGTSFFVPSNLVISDQVQTHSGGSPLLWQHLFWFFGHPGGLHRHRSGNGHRLPHPRQQHAPAVAEPPGGDLLVDIDWIPQLHGVGTSHVCQRDEPALGTDVFFPHAHHHHSVDHHYADLDWQFVRFKVAHHCRVAFRTGLHFVVRQRRRERFLSGAAFDRYLPPCHLLRGWTFPFGNGSCFYLWHLRRNLLLVP